MDDHEFPLPVAVLTIVIARLVLFWQRLSDRLPPGSVRLGQLAVAPAHEASTAGSAWPKGRSNV